jgi:IS5 family transposase
MKQINGDLFAAQRRQAKMAPYTQTLQALERLVDWDSLARVVDQALGRNKPQPKGGRPGYPTQVMVKILVLQQLYGNLSDEQMEYALLDRSSWQRFVGLQNALDLPDARTLWLFKDKLANSSGATDLFGQVQRQLATAGLAARGGQLVDATIVAAPRAHISAQDKATIEQGQAPEHWSEKQAAHIDTDAKWTGKHGQWHFGYKAHANVDQAHKIIRELHVTSANVNDITVLEPIIDTDPKRQETGKTVHADKGYDSAANRAKLKEHGLRDGIARKDNPKRYDQSQVHARNGRLARIRARVEHVFGTWEKVIGKAVRCIGLKRATAQITVQALVYNLTRWVTLDRKGAPAV